MLCALCGSETYLFSEIKKRVFFRCNTCDAFSLHPAHFLSPEDEKKRYLLHQNDINDLGYQKFVFPIVSTIYEQYNSNHNGLDFGSGTGPVITSLLEKKGYNITTYDPFFDPNNQALKNTYDYIICCEVMEHFWNPVKEFKLLYNLLKQGGTLYCKTSLYNTTIDFNAWWYKNDPTHVFFYTEQTLQWIKNHFGFKSLKINENLITLTK